MTGESELRYVNVVNIHTADYRSILLDCDDIQSIKDFILALDAMGATHIYSVTSEPEGGQK